MDGETRLEGKIPRVVIRWHEYGYRAEPGHLIVDIAQRDPTAALITNRTGDTSRPGKTLLVQFTSAPSELFLIPGDTRFPLTEELLSTLDPPERSRDAYVLPADQSLLLIFGGGARGVLYYRAFVEGTDIEVSGGSGPDIIIER